jgi:hypothetical protein
LIHLHTTHPTFSTENFVFSDQNFFVKMVHLNHPEMDAAVLANFRVIESNFNPKFQYAGTWYEYFTGDSLEVTDTQERLTFDPGEYRIYTSKRLTPPGGFISATHDLATAELEFFPNPLVIGGTVFTSLPSHSEVNSVALYDMSGRLTISCSYEIDGDLISIDIPEKLASGVYIIRIRMDRDFLAGKVLKE